MADENLPIKLGLSGERLALYEALLRKHPRIARMYASALFCMNDQGNPEPLCLAAHQIRELMEKTPQILEVDTPAYQEGLGVKVRELADSFSSAIKTSKLKPPKWDGKADEALAAFLRKCVTFCDWFEAHVPKRRAEVITTFRALDGPGHVLAPDMEDAIASDWIKLRKFFMDVAHHQAAPGPDEFEDQFQRLEGLLLKKLNKQTFADFDQIDAAIEEAQRDDQH